MNRYQHPLAAAGHRPSRPGRAFFRLVGGARVWAWHAYGAADHPEGHRCACTYSAAPPRAAALARERLELVLVSH